MAFYNGLVWVVGNVLDSSHLGGERLLALIAFSFQPFSLSQLVAF